MSYESGRGLQPSIAQSPLLIEAQRSLDSLGHSLLATLSRVFIL